MTVDFSKPIRLKAHPSIKIRFLGRLDNTQYPIAIAIDQGLGNEGVRTLREEALENTPESRWLNVYALGHNDPRVSPRWRESKHSCLLSAGHSCIGTLEDKQDGTPYIFHPKS